MIESIVIVLLGLSGFFLALYLRWKKAHKSEVFVCPLRENCTEVIHSDYSKIFGATVELIGTFYYLVVAIRYAFRVMPPMIIARLIFICLHLFSLLVQYGFKYYLVISPTSAEYFFVGHSGISGVW